MKSFTTGAGHHDEPMPAKPITFDHDGRTVTAHPPTTTQYAMFMAAYESLDGGIDRLGDVIDFFFCLFDEEDQDYFRTRLFDRADSFGMTGVGGMADMLNALLPVWTRSAAEQALSH
jgi:hypothetical protein